MGKNLLRPDFGEFVLPFTKPSPRRFKYFHERLVASILTQPEELRLPFNLPPHEFEAVRPRQRCIKCSLVTIAMVTLDSLPVAFFGLAHFCLLYTSRCV